MKIIFTSFFNNKINIYLIFLFFILRLIFLFTMGEKIPITTDYENRYKILAENIINGNEYGAGSDLVYPPLYPIFIALNFVLFDSHIISIKIIQILFDLIICALLCFIGTMLVNKKIGSLAMILWGIYPMAIWQTNVIGTEVLFTVILLFFMLFFIISYQKESLLFSSLSGAFLGLAMLTRPLLTYFPVVIFMVFWFNLRRKKNVLKLFSIFLVCFYTTLSPWILRNFIKYNEIEIGTKHPDGQGVVRLFFEGSNKDYVFSQGIPRFEISDFKRDSLYSVYNHSNISKNEILFNSAITNIISNPFTYIKLIFYKIWKLFTFSVSGKYDTYIKLINLPILATAIFGVYAVVDEWRKFISLILIIIYFIGIYSLLISMARYLMPVMPFIIIFSAVGLDKLFAIIIKRRVI